MELGQLHFFFFLIPLKNTATENLLRLTLDYSILAQNLVASLVHVNSRSSAYANANASIHQSREQTVPHMNDIWTYICWIILMLVDMNTCDS